MAANDLDPCRVLDTLIQKHSNLGKYATTDADQATKVLDAMVPFKEEIEYIRQQLMAQMTEDSEQKEDADPLRIVFHLTGFGKFGKSTHLLVHLFSCQAVQ